MSNIGSYDERYANFSWQLAEKELGVRARRPAQHRLALFRPDLPEGPRRQDRPALGRPGRRGKALHLRRHPYRQQHHRPFPARPRHRRRGPGLSVHGQDSRALPRRSGHPEDRGDRPAALLGLRRRIAVCAPGERPDQGHHHPAQARPQGPQDPGQAALPEAYHHRRPRRQGPAAEEGSRLLPGQGRPGRKPRDPPDPGRIARPSSTTPPAPPDSPRASSTSTTPSSPST